MKYSANYIKTLDLFEFSFFFLTRCLGWFNLLQSFPFVWKKSWHFFTPGWYGLEMKVDVGLVISDRRNSWFKKQFSMWLLRKGYLKIWTQIFFAELYCQRHSVALLTYKGLKSLDILMKAAMSIMFLGSTITFHIFGYNYLVSFSTLLF